MMEMGECEICNRYRHAKHKGEQLEILAELNDVPRQQNYWDFIGKRRKCKTSNKNKGKKTQYGFYRKRIPESIA